MKSMSFDCKISYIRYGGYLKSYSNVYLNNIFKVRDDGHFFMEIRIYVK